MRLPLSATGVDELHLPAVYARILTRQGYPALSQHGIAGAVTTELLRTMRRFGVEVVAYCMMPDQVSVLVAATEPGADAHEAIRRWKQVSGATHRGRTGRTLWKPRTPVWRIELASEVLEVAAHLVLEPVRRGLVRSVQEYRWLSAPPPVLRHLAARGKPPQIPPWWPCETSVPATCERRTARSFPR